MKSFTKLLFVVMLSCCALFSEAQQGDTLEIHRNEKGMIYFARLKPSANRTMQGAVSLLKAVLQAKSGDEFRLLQDTIDKLGIAHRKYQQYYRGIKVENAEYLAHGKNGMIEVINGDFQQVNISSVAPSMTEQKALNRALDYVNAQKYKWEDESMEKFIKQRTNNPYATYYPKGELIITKDFLKSGNNLRLAWKFSISSLVPNNEQWIYVDATTGETIRVTPRIYDVNTPCTAETRYSGTVGITGDSFAGGFRLRENRNGADVQTLNLQNTLNYASAIDFTNTNTSWTTGSWTSITQDRQALDAHWGAENVLDYWRAVHNRNSINGNGMAVISFAHAGLGWNNAGWDGTANVMVYGDGDGITFNPLTSLDIAGHEFGHGITQFTSALAPGTQESGALNEGFSDIWGVCVENWAAPAKQTWLMGEEIFATTAFNCVRNLQNPRSITAWEGQHPDTYQGQFWRADGEPHFNSTVLSHWFYLITVGDNGWNNGQTSHAAAGDGYSWSVTGIGINEAQQIVYRATTMYLNSSATYSDARNATIQAARDLFGTCSNQEIAVTNAWNAVGVGAAAFTSTTTVSITSQKTSAPGEPTDYRFTAPQYEGVTYSWYVSGMANNPQQSGTVNTFDWYFRCNVTQSVYCIVSNTCGSATSNIISKTGECIRTKDTYVLSPNPASSTVTVSAVSTSIGDTKSEYSISEVKIYDQSGLLKKQARFDKVKIATLNINNLPTGVYIVEIIDGDYKEQQQLLIKR